VTLTATGGVMLVIELNLTVNKHTNRFLPSIRRRRNALTMPAHCIWCAAAQATRQDNSKEFEK
jgi:hypothetical protein